MISTCTKLSYSKGILSFLKSFLRDARPKGSLECCVSLTDLSRVDFKEFAALVLLWFVPGVPHRETEKLEFSGLCLICCRASKLLINLLCFSVTSPLTEGAILE